MSSSWIDPDRSILENIFDGTVWILAPVVAPLAVWNPALLPLAMILAALAVWRGIVRWRER